MKLLPARDKWLPLILGFVLVAGGVALVREPPSFVERLNYLLYDWTVQLTLPDRVDPSAQCEPGSADKPCIVIVDIDEKSLKAEGHWPWRRAKLASLVDRLAGYGVSLTAFDVVFPEPEDNAVDLIVDALGSRGSTDGLIQQVTALAGEFDSDGLFAASVARARDAEVAMDVVWGYVFRGDNVAPVGALPAPATFQKPIDVNQLPIKAYTAYSASLPRFLEASGYAGFFNSEPDEDGVYRREPLFYRYGDALYPCLALEVARARLLAEHFDMVTQPVEGGQIIREVKLADNYVIPTDSWGRVLIPFVGQQRSFHYVSATDVLQGKADASLLNGAIVFVGSTAPGLYDLRATTVEKIYPGVEIHANLLQGVLNSHRDVIAESDNAVKASATLKTTFPYGPDWAYKAELWATLLGGLLLAVLLPFCGPSGLVLLGAGSLFSLLFVNFALWESYNIVIEIAVPFTVMLLLSASNVVYNLVQWAKRYRQLKGIFGQYVPPERVEEMSRDPSRYSDSGESRDMTVLFADIRSFTTISEALDAAALKAMLNRFFTPMTKIIFDHYGTIDKYVGDMIMAFWGAPTNNPKHAELAIRAALNMLKEVAQLRMEFKKLGLPEIDIGIGLNTGVMNVGDMGSVYRRAYTVIGDSVNLASRLEGLTKYYGVGLVVGESTHEGQTGFVFRKLDRVRVKGKREAVTVYQPICELREAKDALYAELKAHDEAVEHYLRRDWASAQHAFDALITQHPDTRIYKVYLERIADLRHRDLPEDWDGVYDRREK